MCKEGVPGLNKVLFKAVEVASITSGDLIGDGNSFCSSVVIDSRKVEEKSIFVALSGERVDGHQFLMHAYQHGSILFLVKKKLALGKYKKEVDVLVEAFSGSGMGAVILVDNPLEALHQLAIAHLNRFPNLIRIGITGSSGKTTTKELLGAMLKTQFQVRMTEGNFNSEIGLPLMALKVIKGDEVLLLEMGIDHLGEMDRLVSIVRPHYALITGIGTAHIGRYQNKNELAFEKGRIFSSSEVKIGFIAAGDSFSAGEIAKYSCKSVIFGQQENTCFIAKEDAFRGWKIVDKSGNSAELALYGQYNLMNFYGAAAVAMEMGIQSFNILNGVKKVKPLFGRGVVSYPSVKGIGEITVIEDFYNANLESVSESLQFLMDVEHFGKKKIILGAMKELGPESESAHRLVGRRIIDGNFDLIFLHGKEAFYTYDELKLQSFKGEAFYIEEFELLQEEVAQRIEVGDLWFLKGSRSMALERLRSVFSVNNG